MCYIIITGGSLVWFLLSLIADMCIISAIVTPKWLVNNYGVLAAHDISALQALLKENNGTQYMAAPTPLQKYPSVGIYTRCTMMNNIGFHCGRFDLDGFATSSSVYPAAWKACMFFMSLGFALMTLTVFSTLITCCRQSVFGKSIHNVTACAQVVAGISVTIALFLHPLGWGAARVQKLCGPEAEPFYPAACSIGISMYCAIGGAVLSFICAMVSLKAESSNMRTRIKRRVEEGDRLVCIP